MHVSAVNQQETLLLSEISRDIIAMMHYSLVDLLHKLRVYC